MKKLLLFASVALIGGQLNAQNCLSEISTSGTTMGFDPNPIVGSVEGEVYNEPIAIVLPGTYPAEFPPGNPITLPLCGLSIISITGLPAEYDWEVWAVRVDGALGTVGSQYEVTLSDGSSATNKIDIDDAQAWNYSCLRITTGGANAPAPVNPGPNGIDSVEITVSVEIWGDLGAGCANLSSLAPEAALDLPVKLPVKSAIYASIESEANTDVFGVYANFPNPASSSTNLTFTTPTAGKVSIVLYDAVGKMVRNITTTSHQGFNSFNVNTADLRSGIYMYSITYDGKTLSKKMLVNQ